MSKAKKVLLMCTAYVLVAFDQLFGGPADHRYCYYGINAFDGVTVIYNN